MEQNEQRENQKSSTNEEVLYLSDLLVWWSMMS
jgi:hypothetical protein